MHIVFWQNIVSPHQSAFMRALANRGHEVTVVAAQRMSVSRRQLGWQPPDLGRAVLIVGPSPSEVRRLVHNAPSETIHCIAGARVLALGALVARECRSGRRRMGIITETPDPRGLRGLLRWGKYAAERLWRGGSFDFVLAMGETGVRWFRACGYPANRVFPFAYATEVAAQPDNHNSSGPCRLVFVGRLVDLKGVDVLLKALARSPGVELEVIGDGPLRGDLESLAETLGIAARVRWLGQLDSSDIPPRVSRADVLVLPSRKDGWGAVVNEALMLGTPVICSTACGASDLIRHDWLGTVVKAGDVGSIAQAISGWSGRGRRTAAERRRIREWASCITGESLAEYLEAILRHVYETECLVAPPWRLDTGYVIHR